MKPSIYMVGGSKGGVGKSMIAIAMIDYMKERGEKMMLVETDTSNPDVAKTYSEIVQTETIDLDGRDGWMAMLDCIDKHKDANIIINSAARNNLSVAKYGSMLDDHLPELDRKMITLWVINRQRDSLELLRDYIQTMPKSRMHVIRNAHFGAEEKFELYNGSKIRATIEDAGGKSLTFPDLADRVADEIYSKRVRIEDAQKTMTIGNRAELQRWRAECKRLFDEVMK